MARVGLLVLFLICGYLSGTELYKQKRKIVLLVDNAPGHSANDYNNIELVFLPPNTTSKLQPLDQGTISWVKREYKRLITVEYMAGCDQKEDVKTIMKAFDFAVACENTVKAWNRCSAQTIANCFTKAGFIAGPLPEPESELHHPEMYGKTFNECLETNMTFDEYASHDDDVKTCEPLTDEAITEAVIGQCDDGSADTDDPLEVDGMIQIQIQTSADNHKKMKSSGHQHNFLDLLPKPKLMFYAKQITSKGN